MKMFIKYLILPAMILCFFTGGQIKAQVYAGLNKLYIKGGEAPQIGEHDDPLCCYSWEPKDGLSDWHSPKPFASPDSTTTYKLTIVGPGFSYTYHDEVTVYVAKKLKLEVENNLTECMQDRELTFSIKIEGSLPTIFTDQLEFSLYHQSTFAEVDKTSEWSFDTQEDITVTAVNTSASNDLHKYNKRFVAEVNYNGSTIKSDTLKIDIYELWIDYVKYKTKPWRAVVGEPFELNGMGSPDCTDWDWNLEKVGNIGWSPAGGSTKTSTLTIPYSDIPSAKNTYFGDTYGTVIVKCKDGEGNEHIFKSTNMEPAKKVQVYFKRDKASNGLSYSRFWPPLWFKFWKEFIPWGSITTLAFRGDTSSMTWGSTDAADRRTNIYTRASWDNDETHHKGLHTFFETVVHESLHIEMWDAWWPTGYKSSEDTDGDFYPDLWEQSAEGSAANFKINFSDSYGISGSAGYIYEETRCRNAEKSLNYTLYDNQDWSYDPDDNFQGKQW